MPLLVFSGHPFLAEEALRSTLSERGVDPRTLPRLSGEDVTLEQLDPLLAPGLFGDGGVIVDLSGVKPDKALLERLAQAPVTVALLDEAPPATRVKLYEGKGEHFASPTPQKTGEITTWVTARARQMKLSLDREAATYLAEVFGSDLTGIAGELNKLSLLDPPLNAAKVRQVVGLEPPGDSFALLGAATAGQTREALTQLGRLLERGEDPFKLLGAVVWQYNLIARCVALITDEGRVSEGVAAQRLGVKPYPAKKALAVARGLNEQKVLQHLKRIQEADVQLKRGREARAVMERLIVQLSAPR